MHSSTPSLFIAMGPEADTQPRPDGSIDRTNPSHKPTPTGVLPAHKLGPKANTGAINAGLRALDRTGKPCRRWEKKGLQLKSFTGTVWNMHMWKGLSGGMRVDGDGEMKSDSSSDVNANGVKGEGGLDGSAVQSERSHSAVDQHGDTAMGNGEASSPAAVAVA
jgi:hypothetical protein